MFSRRELKIRLLLIVLLTSAIHLVTGNEDGLSQTSEDPQNEELKEKVVVGTEDGKIEGFLDKSTEDKYFYSFLGIPYAKPPTGNLRLRKPAVVKEWNGVRDGSIQPPSCPQVDMNDLLKKPDPTVLGEEDCLYLNIYTPEPNYQTAFLPVMVYIHGGHFMSGSASDYEPHDLLNYPVVLVVIQYRLGVLGFLSTEDDVMPGNLGLRDQTMALNWVQKNIHYFGGDSTSITLFGSGAGAASAHYLTFSHHTLGLFQRAILQSGSALSPWARGGTLRQAAHDIGHHFGCISDDEIEDSRGNVSEEDTKEKDSNGNDSEKEKNVKDKSSKGSDTNKNVINDSNDVETKNDDTETGSNIKDTKDKQTLTEIESEERLQKFKTKKLLKCLQKVDVKSLTEIIKQFYTWSNLPTIFAPYFDDKFFPERIDYLLEDGRHKRIEMIVGFNKDDGAILTNSMYVNEGRRMALKHHFDVIGPISLGFTQEDVAPLNMSIKAYDKYIGGLEFDDKDISKLNKLFTDRHFASCSDEVAFWHSKNNENHRKNVYFYEFLHRGQNSFNDNFELDMNNDAVSLGDELFYLFPMKKHLRVQPSEADQELKKSMIKMWFYFALQGNPTPEGVINNTWEPYSPESRRFLEIQTKPGMKDDYRSEVRDFWANLPTKQNLLLHKENFEQLLKKNNNKNNEILENKERSSSTSDRKEDNEDMEEDFLQKMEL